MKKIISFLLALTIVFSSVPAFAAGASSFYDVPKEAWYYKDVEFVVKSNLFNGTSANTFSPGVSMSRGMFLTVLGRYAKVPSTYSKGISAFINRTDVNIRNNPSTTNTGTIACVSNVGVKYLGMYRDLDPSSSYKWAKISYNGNIGFVRRDLIRLTDDVFTDVPVDSYYSPYVHWAYDKNLIKGMGTTAFNPNNNISREEICYILDNFCKSKNITLPETKPAISFSDSGNITPAYSNAVSRLTKAGVINGFDDGSFKPKSGAQRCHVAKMLHSFIDSAKFKPEDNGHIPDNNIVGGYGNDLVPSSPVNSSYFNDACFLGHSLVHGMSIFLGLNNADYLYFDGASSTYLMETNEFELSTTYKNKEGEIVHDKGTLTDALSEGDYSKIYIMLGANECRNSDSGRNAFYANMKKLVNTVRAQYPNATFYIFSMTPVTETKSKESEYFLPENILEYNNTMRRLCKDLKLNYLNIYDLLVAEDGFLPEDCALEDGLHILGPEYEKIKNYMFTHTA